MNRSKRHIKQEEISDIIDISDSEEKTSEAIDRNVLSSDTEVDECILMSQFGESKFTPNVSLQSITMKQRVKVNHNNKRLPPVKRQSNRIATKRMTKIAKTVSDSENDETWTSSTLLDDNKASKNQTTISKKQTSVSKKELALFLDSDEEKELTEYELIRQKNIEERVKLFQELQLNETKKNIDTLFKKISPAKKKEANKFPTTKTPLPPRRKSLRIEGIKAAEPSPEEVKQAAARQSFSVPAHYSEWGDTPRNNMDVLTVNEVLLTKFNTDDCIQYFSETCKKITGLKISNELKECDVKTFKQTICNLTLKEHHKLKVVPNRIYSLAIHPTYLGIMVAAGCKTGTVGLWSTNFEYNEADPLQLAAFNYHVSPTSCVTFGETEPQVLYSTSYDGTTRRGDLESGTFSLVYATNEGEKDSHLSWHCEIGPSVLLIGQGNGQVARVDVRESQDKATLFKCHDRSVRTISLHPVTKQHIATTSSFKRIVALWDLRQMKPKGSHQGQLATLQFNKPLSSAFFSPVSGNRLLTTSYDDNLSIFSCGNLSQPMLFQRIHHNNNTGRWLTNFKATWHPQREDVFIIGSMDKPRCIDIFHTPATQKALCTNLIKLRNNELLSTVGAVAIFHPTVPAVVAGNASGYIHLFM